MPFKVVNKHGQSVSSSFKTRAQAHNWVKHISKMFGKQHVKVVQTKRKK